MVEIKKINEIFNVIPFDNRDIEEVIKLMEENSDFKDFEDTLQYYLAKKIDCELIITNNKNFVSIDMKVFTIEDFAKKFNIL